MKFVGCIIASVENGIMNRRQIFLCCPQFQFDFFYEDQNFLKVMLCLEIFRFIPKMNNKKKIGPLQFHTPLSSTYLFNTKWPLLFSSNNPSVHQQKPLSSTHRSVQYQNPLSSTLKNPQFNTPLWSTPKAPLLNTPLSFTPAPSLSSTHLSGSTPNNLPYVGGCWTEGFWC